MDATATATASPTPTFLDKFLATATTVYTGVTNAQIAKSNASAARPARTVTPPASAGLSSNVVKYVLLGIGGLVAVGLVIFLIKRK